MFWNTKRVLMGFTGIASVFFGDGSIHRALCLNDRQSQIEPFWLWFFRVCVCCGVLPES